MRMGGILEAIASLLASMGITLPPWGMPAIVLAIVVVLSPSIWRTLNMGKARKLLKRASIHEGAERAELEAQALRVVHNSKPGLVALAEEAQRRGRLEVARAALDRLRELDPRSKEGRKLRQSMAPKLPNTEVETEMMLERLIDAGTVVAARERLEAARRKWPRHSAWDELEARLEDAAVPS